MKRRVAIIEPTRIPMACFSRRDAMRLGSLGRPLMALPSSTCGIIPAARGARPSRVLGEGIKTETQDGATCQLDFLRTTVKNSNSE